MNNFAQTNMILEGKFIGDFAVAFPPHNNKTFGFKALQKAWSYLDKYYNVELDRLDKNVFSIAGEGNDHVFTIDWEESGEMKHGSEKGRVFSLFISFGRDEYQINTYKELDSIFKRYGINKT
jgi:hypothetical protein